MLKRRDFLKSALALALLPGCASLGKQPGREFDSQFNDLESGFSVRLGLCALDTQTGALLGYRQNERFAFCSTFKVMLAAAVLRQSAADPGLLEKRISYSRADLVEYSPVSEKHIESGLSVAELCAAGIELSDNSAANLLLDLCGGPSGLTAFARSIGDRHFRLDRRETALNSAIPGDLRDTTTPLAMAKSLNTLCLGQALQKTQADQLLKWMEACATGAARIRAGVPKSWRVADKTGTGGFGAANDMAVVYPENRQPMVLAIFSAAKQKDTKPNSQAVAEAAKIAANWLNSLA